MTYEEMKESYSKLGTKLLVTKLKTTQDAEEADAIMDVLAERGVNEDGSPMRKESTVVEIEPETEEEKAEAEVAAQKDPSEMNAAELKAYAKEKSKLERDARKALLKAENQGQRAELNADLQIEAKAANKEKKLAIRKAKVAAKREETLERRRNKMADSSPHGVAILGKRVAFRKFIGTIEDAVVYGEAVGLTLDKRVNMMLIRIKGDDGKLYHKVDTSHDLFLVGEEGELIPREGLPPAVARNLKVTSEVAIERERVKQEALLARGVAKAAMSPYGAPLLGKRVAFKPFFGGAPIYGKAISLVPDKRVNKILVRIIGEEDGHVYHKVDTSPELFEADAEGNLIKRELPEPTIFVRKAKVEEVAPVVETEEAPVVDPLL